MASTLGRAAKRIRLSDIPARACSVHHHAACRPITTQQSAGQAQAQAPPSSPSPLARSNEEDGSNTTTTNPTTHFGYETIPAALKASRVGAVFSSVASSYDTMNDLMSLGIHRLWKDHFVRSLDPGSPSWTPSSSSSSSSSSSHTPPPTSTHASPSINGPSNSSSSGWKILDIAGGTGDIALRLLEHSTLVNADQTSHVTVSDINPAMLAEGRRRLRNTPYFTSGRISFLEADAEDLSAVPNASIDLYTVAFGIRNFTDKPKALREAYRVLKPGGVFACLEFSKVVANPLLDAVYKRWSFGAIPLIGQVVAGDRDSYQYLVESIDRFPSQAEFAALIEEAGFVVPGWGSGLEEGEGEGSGGGGSSRLNRSGLGWENLTGGIAAIHKGVKPV